MADGIECRLCGGVSAPLFHQTILGRYDVHYYLCSTCDLIQSEKPYWLDEAYSSAISSADTGIIQRNLRTADLTSVIGWLMGVTPDARCLDYGGGNGVFVRMMRDRGFDFRLFDRYAKNIFARGFEGDLSGKFSLVTAFEVFEHLEDVNGQVQALFALQPDLLLVGTQLHSSTIDGHHNSNWWYYMPETGQHIAFFSAKTMDWIARKYAYEVVHSNAYTLFHRPGGKLAPRLAGLAKWLLRNSRGDRDNPWLKCIQFIGPRFEPLTIEDARVMGLKV